MATSRLSLWTLMTEIFRLDLEGVATVVEPQA